MVERAASLASEPVRPAASEELAAARSPLGAAHLAAFAPMIWGTTYLVTTQLLPPGKPLWAAAVRALPAGLALTLLNGLPHGVWRWRVLCLGLLNIGLFFPLLFVAAYRLPGGVAAVIGALQPLLVVAISALVLGARVPRRQVLAALGGALGVAMLVLRADARLDWLGVGAAALGTSSMACGTVLAKRWGRPERTSVLGLTGWQLLVGGLFIAPLAPLIEGVPAELTPQNLYGFGYLAVAGALVAYSVWFWGVERLSAASVSLLVLLSPLTAMLLGYLVLDQRLGSLQLLGAALVLGSVVTGQRAPAQVRSGS